MRKGFLLAVALVALLFPSGAGAVEKEWIGNSGESWDDNSHWTPAGTPTDADLAKFSGAGTPVKIDAAAVAGGLKLDSGFLLDIQAPGGSLTLGSANSAVDIELTGGGEAEIRTTATTKLDFVGTVPQLNLNVPSSARLKLGNTSAPAAVHQSGGIVQLMGTVTAAVGGTVWHVDNGLLFVKKTNAFSGNMTVGVVAGKSVQFEKGADAGASFDFAAGSSIASLDMADATAALPALKLNALSGDVTLNLIHAPATLAPGGTVRVIDCTSPIPAGAKVRLDSASGAKYEIQFSGDRRSVMIGTRVVASADAVVFTPSTDSLASREYVPGTLFAASFDVRSAIGQALTVVSRDLPGSPFPAWLGFAVTPKGGVSSDVTVTLSGTPDAGVSGDIKLGFRASTAMASADMVYTLKKKEGGSVPPPNPKPNPNPQPNPNPKPNPKPNPPLLPDPNQKSRGGGGGCDAGLAGIVSLLALLPLRSRRKK